MPVFAPTPGGLLTVHHAHAEKGVPVRGMELSVASDHRLSIPANNRVEKPLGVVTTAFSPLVTWLSPYPLLGILLALIVV